MCSLGIIRNFFQLWHLWHFLFSPFAFYQMYPKYENLFAKVLHFFDISKYQHFFYVVAWKKSKFYCVYDFFFVPLRSILCKCENLRILC